LFNSARPVAPGTPFFLTPGPLRGFNQDTFDANARQTTLMGTMVGPKICDFQSGGLIALTLYNDSLTLDRYGILPVLAYRDLKNEDWRFAAGLQFDIFNPLNPNVLPFSRLAASGNAGAYRGQARVERFLHPSDNAQITLTTGVSEPVPTILTPNLELTEDNGCPNVEARVALALGPLAGEGPLATRPFEWGVSGLVGQIRTTETASRQVVANVWGLVPIFAGRSLRDVASRENCLWGRPSGHTGAVFFRASTSSPKRACGTPAGGPKSISTFARRSCTRTSVTASTTRLIAT